LEAAVLHVSPIAPCDFLVFGGTGDLAMRKLLPALYLRDRDGQLPDQTRIVSISRADLDEAGYRDKVGIELERQVKTEPDDASRARFLQRLHHVSLDVAGDSDWTPLTKLLDEGADPTAEKPIRVLYLSTAPRLFGAISQHAAQNGLVDARSRVVLEKPIGKDLASAREINDQVGAVFPEEQIFRIDHYLGKETVQNLLVLRFANALLEPLWNAAHIDHVQISVHESIGVGGRADYYDGSGALRDMVQNHLLQLLCLVAMEPPAMLDQEAVRDEKLKVLQSLRPMRGPEVLRTTVRGQYTAGLVDGAAVPGYLTELDRPSHTETFVALKTEIQNWRWAGVPFYLRSGKRMQSHASEIIVQFRKVPHSVFPDIADEFITPNRLVLRLQPDEGVHLHLVAKRPGPGGIRLHPAVLNLSFAETFKSRLPDAYERLLMDVVQGRPTLFMRRDEVETAWAWVEPILQAWEDSGEAPKPYPAGTAGPAAATALMVRDDRTWHEEIV
jgi:glucose-6-phosphate 1-dehydrogenase